MIASDFLSRYQTLVFDCDGVLLNSNALKTEAFHEVALPFGHAEADRLVEYHQQRGGISRNAKFQYFVDEILISTPQKPQVDDLVARYASLVFEKLLSCEEASGLADLRALTAGKRWMVVSGGAELELREVFKLRGLTHLFDAGIHGSPTSKSDIFARELACGKLTRPSLYIGDSRYDHVAASGAGLDFLFISGWTEFSDWRNYCAEHEIQSVRAVDELRGLLV